MDRSYVQLRIHIRLSAVHPVASLRCQLKILFGII